MVLGTLGGESAAATDLNNLGQVVGYSLTESGDQHAFLWDETLGFRDLGSMDGAHSHAGAVNDQGDAVGYALDAEWVQHAVIWHPDSTVTDLPGGQGWVDGRAISPAGVVAGIVNNRPVVWLPGEPLTELGHIVAVGVVNAISADGRVAGASDLPGSGLYLEACVWRPDGSFAALGVLSNDGSEACDLNDAGEVVGFAGLFQYGPTVAVHWSVSGQMTDLNAFAPPGWELQSAQGINARGDIVGQARDPEGVRQVFVLWRSSPADSPSVDEPLTDGGATGAVRGIDRRLRVVPNPTQGEARFEFQAPRSEKWSFTLFDASGRQVRALARIVPAGSAGIDWRSTDPLSTNGGDSAVLDRRLPRGLYLVRGTSESGERVTGRFVLTR